MMILRECVRRHHRLPQTLVMDSGREFESVFFETLLARYECTKKTRPPSKARFGSVCERLFGSTNTRFIHTLIGNTQLMSDNVRFITKQVDPKRLASWTFSALLARLSEWAYEVYDTLDHTALGQSPRDAFIAAQSRAGSRSHRVIPFNEEFEMLILPSTTKGTARVVPGRGVMINYIYYWTEAFQVRRLLGFESRMEVDAFLKQHKVYDYTEQDLAQDRATLERILPK